MVTSPFPEDRNLAFGTEGGALGGLEAAGRRPQTSVPLKEFFKPASGKRACLVDQGPEVACRRHYAAIRVQEQVRLPSVGPLSSLSPEQWHQALSGMRKPARGNATMPHLLKTTQDNVPLHITVLSHEMRIRKWLTWKRPIRSHRVRPLGAKAAPVPRDHDRGFL